jgi:hypothetical protein
LIVGFQFRGPAQMHQGGLGIARLEQVAAKVSVCIRVVGGQPNHFLKLADCVWRLPLAS